MRFASQAGLDAMTLALGLLGVRLCVAARDQERARQLAFACAAGAAFGLSAMVKGPLTITPLLVGLVLPSPSYSRYPLPLFPAFAFVAGGAFRAWLAERPARLESILRVPSRIVAGAGIVAIALPTLFGVPMHRDPAAIFALHRDALALAFPQNARVPLVGDEHSAESGTIALHMRRKTEHLSVEDIADRAVDSVLTLGPVARQALVERGYRIEAAAGPWAFLRRDGSNPLAAPPDPDGERPPPSEGSR